MMVRQAHHEKRKAYPEQFGLSSLPKASRRVYLDNAATTPVRPEVVTAMVPYWNQEFGNASSIHQWGRRARVAVEEAREKIAKILNCKPEEIIFTGTNTLSDNLAIQGVAKGVQKKNKNKRLHLITSQIEHHAVFDTLKALEKEGFEVTFLPVDKEGLVSLDDLEKAIKENTVLVSIMYANNEVGTIQPLSEVSAKCKGQSAEFRTKIYFHTDAAAVVDYLPLDVKKLGIDLLTIGAHKFGGPKGIGILYIKVGTPILPLTYGGLHERKLYPGTEAVPLIVGMAHALEIAEQEKKVASARVTKLRDRLIEGVLTSVPEVVLTGHPQKRLADIASFIVKGVEGEALVLLLDEYGIASSTGSACTSGTFEPSHVLLALGFKPEDAHGSLRLSLGKDTSQGDIDYALKVLPPVIEKLREMAPKLETSG